MFRKKRRFPYKILFLLLACSFIITGFFIGYYRTNFYKEDEQPQMEKLGKLDEVEDGTVIDNRQIDIEEISDNLENRETTVTQHEASIREDTKIIYRTEYTICQNTIEETLNPIHTMIGLNQDGLQEYLRRNNLLFDIESFSNEEVILYQKKNAVCPNHYEYYFIQEQNGFITIYYFDDLGKKKIVEETTISISVLPYIDQQKLSRGMFRKTKEEAYQLLEDYST